MTKSSDLLTKLLDDWAARNGEWQSVVVEYRYLLRTKAGLDGVLENLAPEVDDLLVQIKNEERRNLELRIAVANKVAPQDVTEEMFLSYSELLSEEDSALRRVAKANAKKYGRPLLQTLHPDKGGNPDLFILAKQAVNSGDSELLRIFLYHLSGKEGQPDEVRRLIRGRAIRLDGSPLFGVAKLVASGRRKEAVESLKHLLSKRLLFLKQLNTPGAFNNET